MTPFELGSLASRAVVMPGVAPACALAVARRTARGFRVISDAAGLAAPSKGVPCTDKTVFDLASVTKPVVALTFARLWSAGALAPDTPLGALLPEARGTPSEGVSLELLLSHRAGLEAHRELFAPLLRGEPVHRREALRAACAARRPECLGAPPGGGFPPVYSDLGYLIAGAALEVAGGADLDCLVRDQVARPLRLELGSARQWRADAPDRLERAAETETVAFRGGPLVGVVHDENAWALSGEALSGHAGLFGTAAAVAGLGAAMLEALGGRRPGFLPRAPAHWLVRERPGGTLRAGFDGKSPTGSSAGSRMSSGAFGHLGFTGTSLWCDPAAQVVCVILTNRVCPSRSNLAIRRVRPRLNDALWDLSHGPDEPFSWRRTRWLQKGDRNR